MLLYVRCSTSSPICSPVNTFVDSVFKFPSLRMMLLGNVRRDMCSDYSTNLNAPSHLITPSSTPLSASSTVTRTPITPQSTMMNYARTPYRYTTVSFNTFSPVFPIIFSSFSGYIAFFTATNGNNDIS